MNSVILIGRLTAKPELAKTKTGTSVCKFTLAVDGSAKDETDFLDITSFGKTAENLEQFKNKGDMIAVKGRMKKDTWKDNGITKSRTYVIAETVQFLSSSQKKEPTEGYDPTNKDWNSELPF